MHAHREASQVRAMAVLKTNKPVPPATVERIREVIDPEVALALSLP